GSRRAVRQWIIRPRCGTASDDTRPCHQRTRAGVRIRGHHSGHAAGQRLHAPAGSVSRRGCGAARSGRNPVAALTMAISHLAGRPAPKDLLNDVDGLVRAFYDTKPDLDDPAQRVSFGTSGHRGSALRGSFTEAHILAISQAICDYRATQGIDGPLFIGKDTHAVSGPAEHTALEVLAANHVETVVQQDDGVT